MERLNKIFILAVLLSMIGCSGSDSSISFSDFDQQVANPDGDSDTIESETDTNNLANTRILTTPLVSDSQNIEGQFLFEGFETSAQLVEIRWKDNNSSEILRSLGDVPIRSSEDLTQFRVSDAPISFDEVDLWLKEWWLAQGGDVAQPGGGGDVSGIVVPHLIIDRTGENWESVTISMRIEELPPLNDPTERRNLVRSLADSIRVTNSDGLIVGLGNAEKTLDATYQFANTDTGQNKCYSLGGTEIDCESTGQDGSYREARQFEELDDQWLADPENDFQWLMSIPPSTEYSFQQATEYCESFGARLPTVYEIMSIADFSRVNPAVFESLSNPNNGILFTDTVTATHFVGFDLETGQGVWLESVDNALPRCVIGDPKTPDPENIIENEIDTYAGLMWNWQGEDLDWSGALETCNASIAGDFSDWRLPNIVELNLMLNRQIQHGTDNLWSSTTNAANTEQAWTYSDVDLWQPALKSDLAEVVCVRKIP